MAGNKQIRREIYIAANGKSAENVFKALTDYAGKLDAQIKQLIKDGKADEKATKELIATRKTVGKVLKENLSDTQRIDKVMKDLAGSSTRQLRTALNALKREMDRTSESSGKLPQLRKQMEAIKQQIDKNTGAAQKQAGAWKTALHNLTAYVGMFAVFNQVKSMMTGVIKKNLDYSGSLTDIRKVAGLAKEDIDDLSKALAKIDTRTTTEGLAQIAYQGAKLGMSKYGVEGMAEFVRAADQINVAIGEEMGEDALPALSKMVEVMGLIPKLGVERSLLSTGSALFKLATTSTATSGNIVEFAKRLTGMSRTAGITTDQLLALGSASDSMMLMPEVASTAFSKLIAQMQKAPGEIEKSLNMTSGRINELFSSGNAMQAIVEILEKMKQTGNMNALGDVFKDLGSDGARLISVMVTMSKNVDILKDHLDVANESFREGEAVTAEYKMQQESAIGIMERAQNLWEKAFVNPGGVDNVKELAKAWYDMSKVLTENAVYIDSMRGALWLLIQSAKLLVYILPALIAGLMFKGVSAAVMGVKNALFGMGETAIWTTLKTEGLAAAWRKLSLAMKANWISALIGLVVELGVVLYETVFKTKALADAHDTLNGYLDEAASAWDKERRKIDSYIAALADANTSTDQRRRLIKKFNSEYGAYLDKLGIEVTDVNSLKNAYSALNDEIKKKMYWQLREKAYDDKLGQAAGGVSNATMDYSKYINSDKGATWNAFDTKWLQEQVNKGQSADAIYKNMVESVYGKGGVWSGYNGDYITNGGRGSSVSDAKLKSYIANFVKAGQTYNTAKKEIDDAFNPIIGDYDPFKGELPGTLDNDNTKGGSGNGKGGSPEKREEQIAKDRANALIANIKAFYEEQQRKYIEWVAKQNAEEEVVSEGQQKVYIDHLEARMKKALGKARQSIATLDDGWKQFYEHMDEDVAVYDDETSKQLLESIGKSDVEALHNLFTKLSGDLSRENNRTLSENLGALLDQIFANGSKELREAAEKLLAHQRDIQKILNEHDYTGTVDRATRSNLDQLGLLNPASGINADTQEGLQKMNDAFDKLTEKARKSIVELYKLNPESDQFKKQFLSFLSVAGDGFDFASLKASELKALYIELIKYNDEYDAAQKKTDDERKKLNDYMWGKTSTQKFDQAAIDLSTEQKKESSRQYSFGAKNDAISPWGQTEATDPELALLQLKMKLAKDYYDYIKAHGATDEQLIAAGKNVQEAYSGIMDAVVAKAQATAEAQRKWYKPIEQYGTALGEAVFDEAKTVKDATRDMINSFIDLTGEYVNQKITQWVMTKLYNGFMAESEEQLAATKQTVAAENASTAVTEAGVEVAAGEAAAGAKTLGQLGWWGIPLLAVIGAVLGGLLSMAKGALSKAFGSSTSTDTTAKINTKLVSGMLTYDSGNVKDLKPFFDKDGNMYWAAEDDDPGRQGISLLTRPTATTINGQRALVAENGPELVIGRETTQAIMQNNPALLKALYQYDKHHSGRVAYDAGNLTAGEAAGAVAAAGTVVIQRDPEMLALMSTLLARLNEPITASINMYGRGGLYEQHKHAQNFMKGK